MDVDVIEISEGSDADCPGDPSAPLPPALQEKKGGDCDYLQGEYSDDEQDSQWESYSVEESPLEIHSDQEDEDLYAEEASMKAGITNAQPGKHTGPVTQDYLKTALYQSQVIDLACRQNVAVEPVTLPSQLPPKQERGQEG